MSLNSQRIGTACGGIKNNLKILANLTKQAKENQHVVFGLQQQLNAAKSQYEESGSSVKTVDIGASEGVVTQPEPSRGQVNATKEPNRSNTALVKPNNSLFLQFVELIINHFISAVQATWDGVFGSSSGNTTSRTQPSGPSGLFKPNPEVKFGISSDGLTQQNTNTLTIEPSCGSVKAQITVAEPTTEELRQTAQFLNENSISHNLDSLISGKPLTFPHRTISNPVIMGTNGHIQRDVRNIADVAGRIDSSKLNDKHIDKLENNINILDQKINDGIDHNFDLTESYIDETNNQLGQMEDKYKILMDMSGIGDDDEEVEAGVGDVMKQVKNEIKQEKQQRVRLEKQQILEEIINLPRPPSHIPMDENGG